MAWLIEARDPRQGCRGLTAPIWTFDKVEDCSLESLHVVQQLAIVGGETSSFVVFFYVFDGTSFGVIDSVSADLIHL